MREKTYFNEGMELMLNTPQMRDLQISKLRRQLKFVYKTSPFFRKGLDEARIKPEDIKNLEDWAKVPLYGKHEQREIQEASLKKGKGPFGEILCAQPEDVVLLSSTSGTTGIPTFYGYSKHDLDVSCEVLCRGFWRTGIRPGDVVLQSFALSMFTAGVLYTEAIMRLGATVVPVGAEAGTRRILQYAELTRPTALMCTPSLANHLIERSREEIGKDVIELGIKRIVCAGEPGVGIPEFRKRVEEAYGARMYDATGGPGLFFISCDTPEYVGMHCVSDDYFLIELVNPDTKEPVDWKDGAIGAWVHTHLDWEVAPFLRFLFGDNVQIRLAPCECGMTGWRLSFIGRIDDMMKVKGVIVYPTAIKNFINSFVPSVTGEFRIVLEEEPALGFNISPPLKLKVEHGPEVKNEKLPSLAQEIEAKCHDLLRIRPVIEWAAPYSIKREQIERFGKTNYFEKRYKAEKKRKGV